MILRTLAFLFIALAPAVAHATCSPAGNEGDIAYSSVAHTLQYCNGTSWIVMGTTSAVSFGALVTNDFCAATSGTALSCTTASTGTGNVVLSASPTLTGTVAGASSTWTGQIAIGTTTLSGAANINGTATATLFSGSGASLTSIGTANLSGITGTPSGATYLRGDGTWGTISIPASGITVGTTTVSSGATTRVLFDNAGVVGEYVITGTGNVVMSASPTLTGTITAANATLTGTEALQFGTDYTTTGTQSDVAINTISAVRYNGSGTATFYGIVAGTAGQILNLHNASSSVLTIANQSSSESTAANKIITGTGADLAMAANSSITLQYDNTAARWRVIGGSGGATAAGTTGQVQYNSGSSTLSANSNFTWLSANNQLVVGTGAATPTGTSGTVAGITMNVIPQSMSYSALSGASGAIMLNPATTGQMAYYSGASAISGTPNLYVSGSNVGIGTTSPNYVLDLGTTGAGLTTAKFGGTAPIYIIQSDPNIGFNLYYNGGWKYGLGSSGNSYGGTIGFNYAAGLFYFDVTGSNGAAGAAATVTQAMTILNSGNVGIGTAGPTQNLDVYGGAVVVRGARAVPAFGNGLVIDFGGIGGANTASIQGWDYGAATSRNLVLQAAGGNVGIGTATISMPGSGKVPQMEIYGTTGAPGLGLYQNSTSNSNQVVINNPNGEVGVINSSGSSTIYGTTSDRRLKENIVPTEHGIGTLLRIQVDDFNFIADPGKQRVQGFIAQNLYKIYPEAVIVGGDDPKKHPWTVDYGRLTPLLVKSIQELKAENDNLRAELKAANENEAVRLKTIEDEIAHIKAAAVTGKGATR